MSIELWRSHNNNISKNMIDNNNIGINLDSSDNNRLFNNSVFNNNNDELAFGGGQGSNYNLNSKK